MRIGRAVSGCWPYATTRGGSRPSWPLAGCAAIVHRLARALGLGTPAAAATPPTRCRSCHAIHVLVSTATMTRRSATIEVIGAALAAKRARAGATGASPGRHCGTITPRGNPFDDALEALGVAVGAVVCALGPHPLAVACGRGVDGARCWPRRRCICRRSPCVATTYRNAHGENGWVIAGQCTRLGLPRARSRAPMRSQPARSTRRPLQASE